MGDVILRANDQLIDSDGGLGRFVASQSPGAPVALTFARNGVPRIVQVALAERGALLERCFTTPHTGKCPWERVYEGIRATGAERNLLSSDLGQPANPPVEDGVALFADRLLANGFSEDEVTTMTVVNSRRLAGAGVRVA